MRTGFALLLAAALPLAAATEWTYGSSDHFEIYTTGGPGKAKEALNYFERIHAFYADVLKADPETKAPTRVILFSNQKEFLPFRPSEGAFAFYQAGPDRDYIVMQSLIEQAYPVVVHEYMHLIAKHLIKTPLPLWLNEGWAEYFSTVQPRANKMSVGAIPQGQLYQVTQMKLMPLDRLFAVGHNSPEYNDKKLMGEFYAQSWALTHMLLASQDYSPGSPKFLTLMLNGSDTVSAIKEAYDVPLAKIQKDLEGYIRVGSFVLRLYDYKSPKPRKDLETRPATAFEAKLVTANMQAISRDGEQEARAAFGELEKEDAKNLELQESIASFEFRRGHPEAALPHFARAAELGSTNWQMYRDYAYATKDNADRSAMLGKAVSLNGNDLDLRIRWATSLLSANAPAQAKAALAPVKNVDRDHAYQFFQVLAFSNMRLNELEEAKLGAGRALEYAANDRERDSAQQLVSSITKQMEYRESVKKYEDDQKRYAEEMKKYEAEVAARKANTEPDSTGVRPQLRRLDAPAAPPAITDEDVKAANDALLVNYSDVVVEAKWQQLDCSTTKPVMVFTTAQGPLRLSMNNPGNIILKGAGGVTADIFCGDQKNKPVRVGYKNEPDAKRKIAGDVRFLEFQK